MDDSRELLTISNQILKIANKPENVNYRESLKDIAWAVYDIAREMAKPENDD